MEEDAVHLLLATTINCTFDSSLTEPGAVLPGSVTSNAMVGKAILRLTPINGEMLPVVKMQRASMSWDVSSTGVAHKVAKHELSLRLQSGTSQLASVELSPADMDVGDICQAAIQGQRRLDFVVGCPAGAFLDILQPYEKLL